MASLPLEIHQLIVSHLRNIDLCNYRLVSKAFADIGAGELFRVVKFHASRQSLDRIAAIATRELRKYVRVVAWDTNLWNVRLDEWPSDWGRWVMLLEQWGRVRYADADETTRFACNTQFHQYMLRKEEEDEVLQSLMAHLDGGKLEPVIDRFVNLQKMWIVNGGFTCRDRQLIRHSLDCDVPVYPDLITRGEFLYHQEDAAMPAVGPFWATSSAFCSSLKKLRVAALHWTAFSADETILCTYTQLTSLSLQITVRRVDELEGVRHMTGEYRECSEQLKQGHLKAWLRGFPALESLKLHFEGWSESDPTHKAATSIGDAIPLDAPWPALRKLSVRFIETSEEDIIRLFTNLSSSLKDLRLSDVCINSGPENWDRIFQTIRGVLRLDAATIDRLSLTLDGVSWDVEEEGEEVSRYFVHGGEYPPIPTLRKGHTRWTPLLAL